MDETSSLHSPFEIDGHLHPPYPGLVLDTWKQAARSHGYTLVGRACDRFTLVTECHGCGTLALASVDTVLAGLSPCPACRNSEVAAAMACLGAQRVSRDPAAPDVGIYRLGCSHHAHLSDDRLVAAATGGAQIDCSACRDALYAAVAAPVCEIVGPAPDGDPMKRVYRHRLDGWERVLTTRAAYRRQWDPAAPTGTAGHEGPCLYLVQVETEIGTALKCGSSVDVRKRIPALGPTCAFDDKRDHTAPLPRKDVLLPEESRIHSYMRKTHPDLVVPREEIGRHIACVSEIYDLEARPILRALMDEVEARYRAYDGRHGLIAPS